MQRHVASLRDSKRVERDRPVIIERKKPTTHGGLSYANHRRWANGSSALAPSTGKVRILRQATDNRGLASLVFSGLNRRAAFVVRPPDSRGALMTNRHGRQSVPMCTCEPASVTLTRCVRPKRVAAVRLGAQGTPSLRSHWHHEASQRSAPSWAFLSSRRHQGSPCQRGQDVHSTWIRYPEACQVGCDCSGRWTSRKSAASLQLTTPLRSRTCHHQSLASPRLEASQLGGFNAPYSARTVCPDGILRVLAPKLHQQTSVLTALILSRCGLPAESDATLKWWDCRLAIGPARRRSRRICQRRKPNISSPSSLI